LLSKQEFIKVSIETNLFFQRIMKEHLFFIETNLQPVETAYIAEANMLKLNFEQLLNETIYYANGIISENAIKSNEIVTPYTLKAEQVTSKLTGARINTEITWNEYKLLGISMRAAETNPMLNEANLNNSYYSEWLENIIFNLNTKSYALLQRVIAFKKKLLALALECKIFITLYPEMQEHLIHESEYYLEILKSLQEKNLPKKTLCEELNFWNHIMGEHAEFIDGMLDPTEKNLKKVAETSAKGFEKLVEECIKIAENEIVQRSLESTEEIKAFKKASTEGLLECKIKSIIPPLLADHVLREANHYLRLLKMINK